MRIGAHVSSSGGISKAIDRGLEIGCETIQIFGSAPQSWAFKPIPESEIEAFKEQAAEADLGPVFFHAIYLINMGNPNPENVEKGVKSLVNYMKLAESIGAAGVIFHPGSHGGKGYEAVLPQTVEAINRVLDDSPEGPILALENMAGMGQHIGARFDELGGILKAVGSPRVGICLDTQHSFAVARQVQPPAGGLADVIRLICHLQALL